MVGGSRWLRHLVHLLLHPPPVCNADMADQLTEEQIAEFKEVRPMPA